MNCEGGVSPRLLIVILALVALAAVQPAAAQLATIRGMVREDVTFGPLPGASVVMEDEEGNQKGTLTDALGGYLINRLSPGTWVLRISFVGYETVVDTLNLAFSQTVEYNLTMQETEAVLGEVVVEGGRGGESRSTAGLEVIRPSDLSRVPMPDVAYDLAGYLLTLPGFVSTGDRGGQLFVRGGTATQNLVLVDGIPVFQPFHIIGFYSAFPADIIAYADVYAGGFGARYGGRISSVIDVATINGNKNRARGAASVAPFMSSVRFELPVEPGKVSVVGSVRQSTIEHIAPTLLGQELPYRFGDRFLKLHAYLNQTSSLAITGIQTFDEGDLGAEGQERPSTWRNDGAGFRYTFLPTNNAVMSQLAAYYSRMQSTYQPSAEVEQRADVDAFHMEMLFAYLMGTYRVNIGLFGTLNNFHYNLGPRSRDITVGVTSAGGYLDTQFEINPQFRIEPGIRYEVFTRGVRGSVAPRIRIMALPFGPGSRQQWSFAWGRYHQQIVGLNNEQDVADVFTIWAPAPANRPVPKAVHTILGVQQRVFRWLELSVEAYSKTMENLAFPIFSDRPNALLGFSQVKGESRGVDLRAEVTRRQVYASLAYTLAQVEYEWTGSGTAFGGLGSGSAQAGDTFHPPHDRRHQINASIQLTRGSSRISARWQLGSGLPFTQINGFYRELDINPEHLDEIRTDVGTPLVSRGPAYGARLPAYHRLDISLEHDFDTRRATTMVQAGLINAYNRPNIFQYNFFSGERADQLPLVPSVGIAVKLK